MKKYDLIIVGAGPAGLTAAIYAARFKLKTLVLGNIASDLAAEAADIRNFPGYEKISGLELLSKMQEQAKKFGAEILSETPERITKNKDFEITTEKNKYAATKVIWAAGGSKIKLNLKNEKNLVGKGVNYCVTCDAALYNGKTVAVLGGGNAALMGALELTKYAKKVYLIYRKKAFFRPEKIRIEQVRNNKKIKILLGTEVTEFIGKDKLEAVKLRKVTAQAKSADATASQQSETLSVDGVFIEFGSLPNSSLAEELGVELVNGYIKVDKWKKTNVKGFFAAGDVTDTPLKQIITACADGAIAASEANKEIQNGN